MPLHAKSLPDSEDNFQQSHLVVENKSIIVEKVSISGLKKTKNDYVVDDVKKILNETTFVGAYVESIKARDVLMSKGIFKNVEVIVDTTKHQKNHRKNGIQIVFKCTERSKLTGGINTEISNTEHPRWILKLLSPNVFGRGENISFTVSRKLDSKSGNLHTPTDFSLNFVKPLPSKSNVRLSLLSEKNDNPWNSTNLKISGIEVEYKLPWLFKNHTIGWNGYWRELSAINKNSSFYVRERFGNSLKSSLVHTMAYDTTGKKVFPKKGFSVKLTEELAGFGGDDKFLKEHLEFGLYKSINNVTFAANGQAGYIHNFGESSTHLQDKFYLGGPVSLRGFELNSVGCKSDNDFIGGNMYWIVGLHAYTPLPFYWRRFGAGSFLDNFRLHGFFNAGNNASNTITSAQDVKKLFEHYRATYGIGIAYSFLNWARIELNYCFPFKAESGDKLTTGFQFGIGVNFT